MHYNSQSPIERKEQEMIEEMLLSDKPKPVGLTQSIESQH